MNLINRLFHRQTVEEKIETEIDKSVDRFTSVFINSYSKTHVLTYEPDNALLEANIPSSDNDFSKLTNYALAKILSKIHESSIHEELETNFPSPTISMAIQDLMKYSMIDLNRKLNGKFHDDYHTFLVNKSEQT